MTGSILKIIAAVTMLIDHAGLMLFPQHGWMRLIGRIAFPLYAYCIAEGFRYTRNRMRYFLQIFILGIGCQLVYTIAERTLYLGILLTFSLSIVLMTAADGAVHSIAGEESLLDRLYRKINGNQLPLTVSRILNCILFPAVLGGVFWLTRIVEVDYGFFGIILPLFAFLPENAGCRKILFFCGMLALALDQFLLYNSTVQFWSAMAIPILLAYNGHPGKYRMKWFFYIFYPAHMVVLYLISMFI